MSNLRRDTLTRLNECENPPSCSNFPAADIPILGECENHPPCSHFPANDIPICVFAEMMYKVAYSSGYERTKTEFTEDFVNCLNGSQNISGLIIQKGSVEDFPENGVENAIYIDTEHNHIYYWKENAYYRISTMSGGGLEDGTILDGGNAFTI